MQVHSKRRLQEAEEAPAEASSGEEGGGERIEVEMPQMGESVMEGEVIEWLKNVGDTVEVDEATARNCNRQGGYRSTFS
jgi:hypothetical protein